MQGTKYWRNRVARVAKKFEEFTFAFAAKSDFSAKMSDWGFNSDNDDVYAAAHDAKGLVYKMEDKFSVDSFTNFVNEFKDDKLSPYIKSEEPPADNSGPVKVWIFFMYQVFPVGKNLFKVRKITLFLLFC